MKNRLSIFLLMIFLVGCEEKEKSVQCPNFKDQPISSPLHIHKVYPKCNSQEMRAFNRWKSKTMLLYTRLDLDKCFKKPPKEYFQFCDQNWISDHLISSDKKCQNFRKISKWQCLDAWGRPFEFSKNGVLCKRLICIESKGFNLEDPKDNRTYTLGKWGDFRIGPL